jgi:hypothetical protein
MSKSTSNAHPSAVRRSPIHSGLSRRRVLRGLGGAAIALPFLELFHDRTAKAQDATAPLRYVVAFAGSSLGMQSRDFVVPEAQGPLVGNLSHGLQPLADFGVEDVTSLVSGLEIPFGPDGSIPAGGRAIQWHSSSKCPHLCGVKSASGGNEKLTGPTSDWIVADAIGGPTFETRPVLTYRVQPAYYRGTNGTGGNRGLMSARMKNGELEQITPQFSPQVAFQDLFAGFVPSDPQEAAEALLLLERRRSILDLVADDTGRLIEKLGAADKQRLERHLDELRALENKLQAIDAPPGGACKPLDDPGPDPDIGDAYESASTANFASNGAWSDEETRASVLVDLIHMAFACDLSRVSSLMFTYAQCFMNMNPLFSHKSDLHQLGHFGAGNGDVGATAMADGVAWHVKHIARLTDKLRSTTDVDGSTLLDNTAIVLVFEGGWGFDPEQNKEGTAHSSENMAVLVAGGAGGLNMYGGQHIRAVGQHPVKVINTVMGALGVPGHLGEVTGTIAGLVG